MGKKKGEGETLCRPRRGRMKGRGERLRCGGEGEKMSSARQSPDRRQASPPVRETAFCVSHWTFLLLKMELLEKENLFPVKDKLHTLEKCWEKRLGPAFSSHQSTTEDDDYEPDFHGSTEADVHEAAELSEWNKEELYQWDSADDECPTYEHLMGAEVVCNVTIALVEASVLALEPQEDDNEERPPPPVSEAIELFEASLCLLETLEVDHIKTLQLRSILDFACSQ